MTVRRSAAIRLVPLLAIDRSAELGFVRPAGEVEVVFVPESIRGVKHRALSRSPSDPVYDRIASLADRPFVETCRAAPAEEI